MCGNLANCYTLVTYLLTYKPRVPTERLRFRRRHTRSARTESITPRRTDGRTDGHDSYRTGGVEERTHGSRRATGDNFTGARDVSAVPPTNVGHPPGHLAPYLDRNLPLVVLTTALTQLSRTSLSSASFPASADIVTLLAVLPLSIDISCPSGAQQQTRRSGRRAAVERRDRQTDGRTDGRTRCRCIERVACFASNVNNTPSARIA